LVAGSPSTVLFVKSIAYSMFICVLVHRRYMVSACAAPLSARTQAAIPRITRIFADMFCSLHSKLFLLPLAWKWTGRPGCVRHHQNSGVAVQRLCCIAHSTVVRPIDLLLGRLCNGSLI